MAIGTIGHRPLGESYLADFSGLEARILAYAAEDTARLDWYEKNTHLVIQVGRTWYARVFYGKPLHRFNSMREAIDWAMYFKHGATE